MALTVREWMEVNSSRPARNFSTFVGENKHESPSSFKADVSSDGTLWLSRLKLSLDANGPPCRQEFDIPKDFIEEFVRWLAEIYEVSSPLRKR